LQAHRGQRADREPQGDDSRHHVRAPRPPRRPLPRPRGVPDGLAHDVRVRRPRPDARAHRRNPPPRGVMRRAIAFVLLAACAKEPASPSPSPPPTPPLSPSPSPSPGPAPTPNPSPNPSPAPAPPPNPVSAGFVDLAGATPYAFKTCEHLLVAIIN